MAVPEPEDLFPLPLTAFEEFMLADESDEFPMVFYLQVRLRGQVDLDVMRHAVEDGLSRHPLLGCVVQKVDGQHCWVWAGADIPEADWDPEHWQSQQPWNQAIDLTQDIGLRVWGQQFETYATLTLQFHHACCDGIAAAQFLEDVALAYARHYGLKSGSKENLPELRQLDLQLLKTRNSRDGRRVANIRGNIFRRIRILCKYTIRYLRQKKVPFAPGTQHRSDPQNGLEIISDNLCRRQTRAIRDAAKRQNASLNDFLVRELMMTADTWAAKKGRPVKSGPGFKQPTWCVLVPTSLRGPNDSRLPACNVVSYVFMARSVALVEKPETLLQSIRDEMQLVHKHQGGWLFVQAIESMQKVPGLFGLVMRKTQNSCMSTTVLSHMGNLLNAIGSRLPKREGLIQMGNLLVEEIGGVPPIRKGTSVAFSTMIVGGCLAIRMRCCPARFSRSEARELLSTFRDQLVSSCGDEDRCEETKSPRVQ